MTPTPHSEPQDATTTSDAQNHGPPDGSPVSPGATPPRRRPGTLAGLGKLDDAFFEPMSEEELQLWEGPSPLDI